MPRFFSILLLAGALFCSVAQSVYSLERMAQRDTVVEEAQTGHAAHFLPAVLETMPDCRETGSGTRVSGLFPFPSL